MSIDVDLISSSDAWYYSDRAGVLTLQDADTVAVIWDMDNDGSEDAGLMVIDGQQADGYIDLYLANEGVTVPVDLDAAADHIVTALADVNNHLAIWYGWHRRGLVELRTNGGVVDLAGLMSGYKAYADQQLEKIADILLKSDASEDPPASTGALTVVVGDPKQYPGTGSMRPAAITVANLSNGASW